MILRWEESHWLPRKADFAASGSTDKIFRSRTERRGHDEGNSVAASNTAMARCLFLRPTTRFLPSPATFRHSFSADRLANLIHHSLRRNPYLQRYSHGNRPPFRTASHGSTSCRQCHRTQSHQHPDSLPPHSRKQWKPDRIRRRHLAQTVTFRYRTYTLLYRVKSYEILPSLFI